MSEPRKINTSGSNTAGSQRSIHTGSASSSYADPRLEEARARARADAEAARMRRSQQFPRVTQQQARPASGAQVRHLDLNRTQGAKPAYDVNNDAEFAERQRRRAAQAAGRQQAARPAQSQPRTVNTAPRQAAPAQQASAPRQIHRAGTAQNTTGRTIQRTQPAAQARPVQQAGAAQPQQAAASRPEAAKAAAQASSRTGGGIRMEGAAGSRAGRSGGASAGGQPPKGPGKGRKGGAGDGGNGKGKKGKGKKKGLWWKILLGTVLAVALIFAGTVAVILNAIRPEGGSNLTISQLLNTPEGLDGEQLNILVLGIDRSAQGGDMAAGSSNDSQSNDGNTDMIMYVQLDFVNDEVRMLQIPRNIMVTTDYDVSHNYQINNVARTQGSDGNNNYDALRQLIYDQVGLYTDGYVAIRLEALVELVDLLGPIQIYVPDTIDYGDGSRLDQGLQWMDGATAEFFLRARETYTQGDIQRLNVQRYFYSAMFARLRDMTVWDIAKILPVVMNYMETDLSVSKMVSAAVSLLTVSSDHIMLCQVPVYMGGIMYQSNDIVVVARQEAADLLNTYFRTPETQLTADQLNVCDNAVDISGRSPTDPNVQYMGSLNEEVVTAAGEDGTEIDPNASYDLPAATATPAPDASGADSGSSDPSSAADAA